MMLVLMSHIYLGLSSGYYWS